MWLNSFVVVVVDCFCCCCCWQLLLLLVSSSRGRSGRGSVQLHKNIEAGVNLVLKGARSPRRSPQRIESSSSPLSRTKERVWIALNCPIKLFLRSPIIKHVIFCGSVVYLTSYSMALDIITRLSLSQYTVLMFYRLCSFFYLLFWCMYYPCMCNQVVPIDF